jgi:hypothetical protein
MSEKTNENKGERRMIPPSQTHFRKKVEKKWLEQLQRKTGCDRI